MSDISREPGGSLTIVAMALCACACGSSAPSPDTGLAVQVQKLTASDSVVIAPHFGNAVAVSGDTAVIGANEDDSSGPNGGSAYVFERDANGRWREVKKLVASDAVAYAPMSNPAVGPRFGLSVDISGDTIVVGAYRRAGSSNYEGAAYVYERDAGGPDNWGETTMLLSPEPIANGEFGGSVEIEGDTIVVGQPTFLGDCGCFAYVFERNSGGPGNWGFRQALEPDSDDDSFFGWALDLQGDELLIGGAGFHDASNAYRTGAGYLFRRDGETGVWSKVHRFAPDDGATEDIFGYSAELDGDTVVIGAPGRGYDGGPSSGVNRGSAYVFTRSPGSPDQWVQAAKLAYPGSDPDSAFGLAAALRENQILIGATLSDAHATDGGAVYLFERDQGGQGQWGLVGEVLDPDATASHFFGGSDVYFGAIAFADDQLLIGATGDSSEGAQFGAVYVFSLERP